MSRILKVLKKLEQEKSAQSTTTGTDQKWTWPAVRAPRAIPKRPFRQRRLTWVWGVAMVPIAAVFVWYFTSKPVSQLRPVVGEPASVRSNLLAGDSASGKGAPESGERSPTKIDDSPEFVESPRSFKPPTDPSFSVTNSEPVPIKHTPNEKANSSECARVDSQRIRLQAIAWSPVALDRRAVINEEIVCEGETIAGMSIVAINVDDVVFNHQGRLFKALMGH